MSHKDEHSPFVLFEERLEALDQPLRVEEFRVPVQLETKPHGGFVPAPEPFQERHDEVGDDAQPGVLRLLPHVPGQQLRPLVLVPAKYCSNAVVKKLTYCSRAEALSCATSVLLRSAAFLAALFASFSSFATALCRLASERAASSGDKVGSPTRSRGETLPGAASSVLTG